MHIKHLQVGQETWGWIDFVGFVDSTRYFDSIGSKFPGRGRRNGSVVAWVSPLETDRLLSLSNGYVSRVIGAGCTKSLRGMKVEHVGTGQ